jgi:hypothetical protein
MKMHAAPFALGYHRFGSHELLPVEKCPISSPLINRGIAAIWGIGRGGEVREEIGEVEFFANHDDTQIMVELTCAGPPLRRHHKALAQFAAALRQTLPEVAGLSVFHTLRDGSLDNNFILENPGDRYPEIDRSKLVRQGGEIQFFEQAFEWDQLTYLYYPYFWGRRANWVKAINMDDPDTLFTKFLQAGAARVLVPVRPSYERSVAHYVMTSELWGGGAAPAIDEEMYVSIVAELKAQAGVIDESMLTGEAWEVTVPTSLVMLQEKAQLPVFPVPEKA